jgi:hypothetical protein
VTLTLSIANSGLYGTYNELEVWHVFFAFVPGFVLVLLFFFDHQVCALLTQPPDFNLKKASSYHWDLVVLGICVAVNGILGIPPTNCVLPQSPMHGTQHFPIVFVVGTLRTVT